MPLQQFWNAFQNCFNCINAIYEILFWLCLNYYIDKSTQCVYWNCRFHKIVEKFISKGKQDFLIKRQIFNYFLFFNAIEWIITCEFVEVLGYMFMKNERPRLFWIKSLRVWFDIQQLVVILPYIIIIVFVCVFVYLGFFLDSYNLSHHSYWNCSSRTWWKNS